MKARVTMSLIELKIMPQASYLLLILALLLLGLTHGVIELSSNFAKHFIENLESFFPLALALISTPILLIDAEQGMAELNATLPRIPILITRVRAVWGVSWAAIFLGTEAMNLLWGPVPFWSGMLAILGPALFMTGLCVWATLLTGSVVVGYLVALGLPVADLILKVMGAFAAFPPLQLINTFSYRWMIPSIAWWVPKVVMLVAGTILFERAVAKTGHYRNRA